MHSLVEKITSLERRLVWRARAIAACRIGATLLTAALLLGLIDYVVRYRDPGLRIMATAAMVVAAAWAAYRWWYLPNRRQLEPLHVARRVEARFPQLRDSLASAIEFLQQSEEDRTAGSAQLRRLVVAEAETATEGLPLDDVIDRRPLRRAIGWLAVPLILIALLAAWNVSAVGTALARLAAPLGSVEWPRQNHLVFRDVPDRLAAGQTFEVELIDTGGTLPDDVRIEYRASQDSRREYTSQPMTRLGDTMVARRENVRNSFAFRAVGGDDHTMRWHRVEVVEPPQLDSLQITIHPPEYTALPVATAERHLQVLAGTRIEMEGTVQKPMDAARILIDDAEPIVAEIRADAAGNDDRAFHIDPTQWIATRSGPYRLELTDRDGLPVVVGQWNLHVDADTPPSVSWQRPNEELYVTTTAVVPIELVVRDNLAIERVDLIYERSDRSESERERQPAESPIELYRGPTPPLAATDDSSGDSRVVKYDWELSTLELPVGAEMTLHGEAADYRPGIGRTIVPRRVSIVSPEELETRLAERVALIVRQLERTAAIQHTTREEVRRLEIQQKDAGLGAEDQHSLQSAEVNQRRVHQTLEDPVDGVPRLVDSLLDEIEMNRIASSDMRTMLDRVAAELDRLAADPLDVAGRELTAARKALDDSQKTAAQDLSRSLAMVGVAQDDVLTILERLIDELSGKADYRRFARLLAELHKDQLGHQESSRAAIGLDTLPLRVRELTRAQRAVLNKAAAGQAALAARFEKIEHGMDALARDLLDEDRHAAGMLSDAVALARRLAIGIDMRQTAHDLAENRVGQALDREVQIADDLQRVLALLRENEPRRPDSMVEELRAAEQRLAELQKQLAAQRQQVARAEQHPAGEANQSQTERLSKQQQALRRDIEQLARQLERLQAADASESTQQAADRFEKADSNDQHPSPSDKMQQAEEDLEKAADQLAERRQQAEDDLAVEFVRRFQAELGQMVERQQRVVETTAEIDSQRESSAPPPADLFQTIGALAEEEHRLAEKAREHSELLFGLAAVRISLEEAERRLHAAADLLEQNETGPAAQHAERLALARLEAMLQAFAQTADEAGQSQQPGANDGAGAGDDQPQRRPTFELLEVKMLRMLQLDLNERTADHRQRIADLRVPPNAEQRAELERDARELAAEQGRLAELVQNMLTRDNEQ